MLRNHSEIKRLHIIISSRFKNRKCFSSRFSTVSEKEIWQIKQIRHCVLVHSLNKSNTYEMIITPIPKFVGSKQLLDFRISKMSDIEEWVLATASDSKDTRKRPKR